MPRTFLDYTIKFLGLVASIPEEKPWVFELRHFVGIVKYPLKQPAELGSLELGDELLDFNSFCAKNDNVQQYPYGYVIPKEEYLSGTKRITHIICMSHDHSSTDVPEIVRRANT